MKKHLLALCTLVSIMQCYSQVNQNEIKKAQNYLIMLNDIISGYQRWNPFVYGGPRLEQKTLAEWQRKINLIALYADENNKDIMGRTDDALMIAAPVLLDINKNIIDLVIDIQNLNNIDPMLRQENKSQITDRITQLKMRLTNEHQKINRYFNTITKKHAQKALQDAMNALNLILNTLKTRLDEVL